MPLDSTKRFCMACGERKRLTWPKDDPTCCTMTCAADGFVKYAAVGGDWEAAHCTNCGKPHFDHFAGGACDYEVAPILAAQGGE